MFAFLFCSLRPLRDVRLPHINVRRGDLCTMDQRINALLEESRYCVFFGGAGVSAASGIPTFRGKGGIYNTENRWNLPPETILSHTFFERSPEIFYQYYRENLVHTEAQPNAVHRALAELEGKGIVRAVITQNIDGLHQAAGSRNVLELHGSIHTNTCTQCGRKYRLSAVMNGASLPRCACGGLIKPDVVLFEEPLPEEVFQRAFREVERADLLIVAGSSLTVVPAAYLVESFGGAKLILLNRDVTPFDERADLVIREPMENVFALDSSFRKR